MTPRRMAFAADLPRVAGGPMAMEACRLPDAAQVAEDFIQAQQAVGASLGEALGVAAMVHGEAVVTPILQAALRRQTSGKATVAVLDGVALGAPSLANAALHGELATRGALDGLDLRDALWVTSLPDDLHTGGSLMLEGCESLESLPNGLKVDGWMDLCGCTSLTSLPNGLNLGGTMSLNGCTSLTALPNRMKVSGRLYMRGCTAWDGRIPEGVEVGGLIYTDGHEGGIPLAQWRALHPHGEFFDVKEQGGGA